MYFLPNNADTPVILLGARSSFAINSILVIFYTRIPNLLKDPDSDVPLCLMSLPIPTACDGTGGVTSATAGTISSSCRGSHLCHVRQGSFVPRFAWYLEELQSVSILWMVTPKFQHPHLLSQSVKFHFSAALLSKTGLAHAWAPVGSLLRDVMCGLLGSVSFFIPRINKQHSDSQNQRVPRLCPHVPISVPVCALWTHSFLWAPFPSV